MTESNYLIGKSYVLQKAAFLGDLAPERGSFYIKIPAGERVVLEEVHDTEPFSPHNPEPDESNLFLVRRRVVEGERWGYGQPLDLCFWVTKEHLPDVDENGQPS